MTRTTTIRIIKLAVMIALIGIIFIYAISRSTNYARGPSIQISWPKDGITATSSTISISGIAERINKLTLNGNSISTDEKGYWNQTIIVFPGLNKISLEAQDQFDRNTRATINIYGIIPSPATL